MQRHPCAARVPLSSAGAGAGCGAGHAHEEMKGAGLCDTQGTSGRAQE